MAHYSEFVQKLQPKEYHSTDPRLMHIALGMVDEAAEFSDVLKKAHAYGRAIDLVNLDEEAGDILWFIQYYCNVRGKTLAELMHINMTKLAARYRDATFNSEDALNRDLEQERAVLEEASNDRKAD